MPPTLWQSSFRTGCVSTMRLFPEELNWTIERCCNVLFVGCKYIFVCLDTVVCLFFYFKSVSGSLLPMAEKRTCNITLFMEMSQLAIAKRFWLFSFVCIFRFLHSIFCSHLLSIPVFLFAFNSNFWLNFKLRKNICCCLLLLLLSRRKRRQRSKRILYHQHSALRWLVSVATLITTYCCDTSEVWLHLKSTYATFVFLLKCHTKIIVKLF